MSMTRWEPFRGLNTLHEQVNRPKKPSPAPVPVKRNSRAGRRQSISSRPRMKWWLRLICRTCRKRQLTFE